MKVSIEKPKTPQELVHISEKPWSDYTEADYTVQQWHNACLIHQHQGAPTSKDQCKLPVKTPNGALNRNGVHAAAAALAGARSPLKASADEKAKAAAALRRYYSQLGETLPNSLAQSAIRTGQDFINHYGVKGMHWGVRRGEVHPDIAHIPRATRKEAAKDAEEFTRAKLYFGEGAGTRRKLIKATVESKRKKDPLYGQAFDHFVKQTDLGIRAHQARKQRKRTDRREANRKAINRILRETRPYLYQSSEVADEDTIANGSRILEDLQHHGVLGMRWGHHRTQTSVSDSTSGTPKQGMSKKKKIAIGVALAVATVGGAVAVGYLLGKRGRLKISDIDGGKNNIIRLKRGKGAISTLTDKQWNAKINQQKRYANYLGAYSSMAKRTSLEYVSQHPHSGISSDEHHEIMQALYRMQNRGAKFRNIESQLGT